PSTGDITLTYYTSGPQVQVGKVNTVTNGATTLTYTYASSSNPGAGTSTLTTTRTNNLSEATTLATVTRQSVECEPGVVTSGVESMTDPLGRVTTMTYDLFGKLASVTYPEGNSVLVTYDGRGNVVERRTRDKTNTPANDIVETADFPSTCSNPVTCNQPT